MTRESEVLQDQMTCIGEHKIFIYQKIRYTYNHILLSQFANETIGSHTNFLICIICVFSENFKSKNGANKIHNPSCAQLFYNSWRHIMSNRFSLRYLKKIKYECIAHLWMPTADLPNRERRVARGVSSSLSERTSPHTVLSLRLIDTQANVYCTYVLK